MTKANKSSIYGTFVILHTNQMWLAAAFKGVGAKAVVSKNVYFDKRGSLKKRKGAGGI